MDDRLASLEKELKAVNARLEQSHKELDALKKASVAAHRQLDNEVSRIASREARLRAGPNLQPDGNRSEPLLADAYEARKAEIRNQEPRPGEDQHLQPLQECKAAAAEADQALAKQQELVKGLNEMKQRVQEDIAQESQRIKADMLERGVQAYGDNRDRYAPRRDFLQREQEVRERALRQQLELKPPTPKP